MGAASSVPTPDPWEMFPVLDEHAALDQLACAHIRTGTGDYLTVRSGGQSHEHLVAGAPRESYEVLLDHEPPRFWQRYTDADGLLFVQVPPLLIVHHISRHGGVQDLDYEVHRQQCRSVLQLQVLIPHGVEEEIARAISGISGTKLLSMRSPGG